MLFKSNKNCFQMYSVINCEKVAPLVEKQIQNQTSFFFCFSEFEVQVKLRLFVTLLFILFYSINFAAMFNRTTKYRQVGLKHFFMTSEQIFLSFSRICFELRFCSRRLLSFVSRSVKFYDNFVPSPRPWVTFLVFYIYGS